MSISPWDIKFSMLSSLLLANIRILSCFFVLFLVMLSNFLIISVVKENIKVTLVVAIPTGARAMLVKEMIDAPAAIALKTIKILSVYVKCI